MDINYYGGSDGSLTVFTGTGRTLIDGQKQTVSYAQPSQLTATLEYTATSATNYIGPGSTGYPAGGIPGIFVGDLDASSDITNSVANGRIKGLVDIRDTELPILQAQLDELAEKLKDIKAQKTQFYIFLSVGVQVLLRKIINKSFF